MAIPTQYTSRITVPLPSEEGVRKVIGDTYDPEKVLNVFKMFAGTGDMYFALVGLVRDFSGRRDQPEDARNEYSAFRRGSRFALRVAG